MLRRTWIALISNLHTKDQALLKLYKFSKAAPQLVSTSNFQTCQLTANRNNSLPYNQIELPILDLQTRWQSKVTLSHSSKHKA